MSEPESSPTGSSGASSSWHERSPRLKRKQAVSLIEEVSREKGRARRKVIHGNPEERKQRNRDSQAAFQKRRINHIEQLEKTIKHLVDTLEILLQRHQSTTETCSTLGLRNSLLERILKEHGLDFLAEPKIEKSSITSKTVSLTTQSPQVGHPSQLPPGSQSGVEGQNWLYPIYYEQFEDEFQSVNNVEDDQDPGDRFVGPGLYVQHFLQQQQQQSPPPPPPPPPPPSLSEFPQAAQHPYAGEPHQEMWIQQLGQPGDRPPIVYPSNLDLSQTTTWGSFPQAEDPINAISTVSPYRSKMDESATTQLGHSSVLKGTRLPYFR